MNAMQNALMKANLITDDDLQRVHRQEVIRREHIRKIKERKKKQQAQKQA